MTTSTRKRWRVAEVKRLITLNKDGFSNGDAAELLNAEFHGKLEVRTANKVSNFLSSVRHSDSEFNHLWEAEYPSVVNGVAVDSGPVIKVLITAPVGQMEVTTSRRVEDIVAFLLGVTRA